MKANPEIKKSVSSGKGKRMNQFFHRFSLKVNTLAGSVYAFITAVVLILIWLITGPLFHFSDTWQLIINTGTTIVTFLMVFVIQHSQNRDTTALQLKLDELIAVSKANNKLINIENLSDEEVEEIKKHYSQLTTTSYDQEDQSVTKSKKVVTEDIKIKKNKK